MRRTNVMNEGYTSFIHHAIMNLLHDRGLITEGLLLELLRSLPARQYEMRAADPNSKSSARP